MRAMHYLSPLAVQPMLGTSIILTITGNLLRSGARLGSWQPQHGRRSTRVRVPVVRWREEHRVTGLGFRGKGAEPRRKLLRTVA